MTQRHTKAPDAASAYASGARLAVALFRRMEKSETFCNAMELDAEWREGHPQENPIGSELVALLLTGDTDGFAGYCSVLCGYISCTVGGTVPDSDWLAKLVDTEAAAATARADGAFLRFRESCGL